MNHLYSNVGRYKENIKSAEQAVFATRWANDSAWYIWLHSQLEASAADQSYDK